MGTTSEAIKYTELREKTDRQLLALIGRDLELGLRCAQDAITAHGTNGRSPESLRHKAEGAWAEAAKLLPLVYSLEKQERRQLEVGLRTLREALDYRRLAAGG